MKEFLQNHHLLSLAVCNSNELWCASAFYAFNLNINAPSFIIASDIKTKHIQIALSNGDRPIVSGTIALETEKIGIIQGVQFSAILKKVGSSLTDANRLLYLKRFPYAILKGGDLWELKVTELKFTDNKLGFGKKLIYKFSAD